MKWFSLLARNHDYPQPENDYETQMYRPFCLRCGKYGEQISPFRVKNAFIANHSDFLQLNWVFDSFFTTPEIINILLNEGISGFATKPVIIHKKNVEAENRIQLCFNTIISCADTELLPTVTCKKNNEEQKWDLPGPKRYSPDEPYCGNIKYHPPTSLVINPNSLSNAPDLFQTAEWFGSGGQIYRITLCSKKFMNLVKKYKWKGLFFQEVSLSGHSIRKMPEI